jgi:hypothetical protein
MLCCTTSLVELQIKQQGGKSTGTMKIIARMLEVSIDINQKSSRGACHFFNVQAWSNIFGLLKSSEAAFT